MARVVPEPFRDPVKFSVTGTRLGQRKDIDPPAVLVEIHRSLNQRKEGPVATDTDILARAPSRSPLSANDAPRFGRLASEELDSQHLRIRVATVATGSLTFLMSHFRLLPWFLVIGEPLRYPDYDNGFTERLARPNPPGCGLPNSPVQRFSRQS
jgi:hypothetical protein